MICFLSNNLFIIRFSNNLDIHRVFFYILVYTGAATQFTGRRRGWRTQSARLYVWLLRLPVAGAHVTPLGGGRRLAFTVTSLAGGHRGPGDWPIVPFACCSLVRPTLASIYIALSGWSLGRHANDGNVFGRRQPTRTGLTGMLTCWIYNKGTNTHAGYAWLPGV